MPETTKTRHCTLCGAPHERKHSYCGECGRKYQKAYRDSQKQRIEENRVYLRKLRDGSR